MVETAENPAPPPADAKDPIRELLDWMNERRGFVAGTDPKLSQTIEKLKTAAEQPGKTADLEFRTRVAYALQDFTGVAGPVMALPEPLREEMSRLAVSAPGLQNARLGDMLRETPNISDRQLVRDIRQAAFEIIRSNDQNGPDAAKRVQDIEQRLPQATAPGTSGPQQPERSAASSSAERADQVHAAASPGEGNQQTRPETSAPSTRSASEPVAGRAPEQAAAVIQGPGLLSRLVSAMAPPAPERRHTPETAPTPLTDRILAFTRNHNEQRSVDAAEASGQRAIEAVRHLTSGPGAAIMAKIQEAAQADPRGLPGVLGEMREGGRHAELRTQFNSALQQEKSLAAAYDAAATAARQYGTDRQAAEAVILRRPNDAVLAARFERLDAEIGEATSRLPGRQDGRSLTDELGQKAAELVRRAVDAVRSVFSREPRASSSPSPSP